MRDKYGNPYSQTTGKSATRAVADVSRNAYASEAQKAKEQAANNSSILSNLNNTVLNATSFGNSSQVSTVQQASSDKSVSFIDEVESQVNSSKPQDQSSMNVNNNQQINFSDSSPAPAQEVKKDTGDFIDQVAAEFHNSREPLPKQASDQSTKSRSMFAPSFTDNSDDSTSTSTVGFPSMKELLQDVKERILSKFF